MFYTFPFDSDYHCKEDGTHEIKLIQRNIDGLEIAFAEGDVVPNYGTEIDSIPEIGVL